MSVIFDIDHEGGDLSEYDSTQIDGGDLSVEVAAALASTSYGLQCFIDDTNSIYGVVDQTAPGSDQIRYRFYFDPNSFSGDGSDQLTCCQLNLSESPWSFVRTQVFWDGSVHTVRTFIRDDESTEHLLGNWQEITDAPHYIEIHTQRESSNGADDGVATWWLDGAQQGTNGSLGTWTIFSLMASCRLGAIGIYANLTGTIYLDELIGNDDGGEIGPVVTGDLNIDIGLNEAAYQGTGVRIIS